MKKKLTLSLILALTLVASACSSSKTTEEGDTAATGDQQAAAATDAGTDAVPPAATDGTAQAAVDPAAQPTDPNAPVPMDPNAPAPAPAAQDPVTTMAQDTPPPAPMEAGAVPPSPAGSGQFDSYTVQQGDTLMKIAFETYGDLYRWKSILEANRGKVTDPTRIPAGTVLQVEKPAMAVAVEKNGEKYLIKDGDTLGTISTDVYGTRSKWKTIWENNKQLIHDPNRIFAGFYLYYQPDGSAPPTQDAPPAVNQDPLAAKPAVPTGTNTATTTGDSARTPASNGTATQ